MQVYHIALISIWSILFVIYTVFNIKTIRQLKKVRIQYELMAGNLDELMLMNLAYALKDFIETEQYEKAERCRNLIREISNRKTTKV